MPLSRLTFYGLWSCAHTASTAVWQTTWWDTTATFLWLESCEQERESSPVGDSTCGRPCPRSCTIAAWSLRLPSEYRVLRAQAQVHRTLRNCTARRCTSTCWTSTASIDGRPGRSRGYPNIPAASLNLIVGSKQRSKAAEYHTFGGAVMGSNDELVFFTLSLILLIVVELMRPPVPN